MDNYDYFLGGDANPFDIWETETLFQAGYDDERPVPSARVLESNDFIRFLTANVDGLVSPEGVRVGAEEAPMALSAPIDTGNSDDDVGADADADANDEAWVMASAPPASKRRAIQRSVRVADDDDDDDEDDVTRSVRSQNVADTVPRESSGASNALTDRPGRTAPSDAKRSKAKARRLTDIKAVADSEIKLTDKPIRATRRSRMSAVAGVGQPQFTAGVSPAELQYATLWTPMTSQARVSRLNKQFKPALRDIRFAKIRALSADDLPPVDLVSHRFATVFIYAPGNLYKRKCQMIGLLTTAMCRVHLPVLTTQATVHRQQVMSDSLTEAPDNPSEKEIWKRTAYLISVDMTAFAISQLTEMSTFEASFPAAGPSLNRPAAIFAFYEKLGFEMVDALWAPMLRSSSMVLSPVKYVYELCERVFGRALSDNGRIWGDTYSLAIIVPESILVHRDPIVPVPVSEPPFEEQVLKLFGAVPVPAPLPTAQKTTQLESTITWRVYATRRLLQDCKLEVDSLGDDNTLPYVANVMAANPATSAATQSMMLARSRAKTVRFSPTVRVKTIEAEESELCTRIDGVRIK